MKELKLWIKNETFYDLEKLIAVCLFKSGIIFVTIGRYDTKLNKCQTKKLVEIRILFHMLIFM